MVIALITIRLSYTLAVDGLQLEKYLFIIEGYISTYWLTFTKDISFLNKCKPSVDYSMYDGLRHLLPLAITLGVFRVIDNVTTICETHKNHFNIGVSDDVQVCLVCTYGGVGKVLSIS